MVLYVQLEEFDEKTNKAVEELRAAMSREVMIVHHDDADGLCSAAITKRALEREEVKVKAFCLEKIYPEVIGLTFKGWTNHFLCGYRLSTRRSNIQI